HWPTKAAERPLLQVSVDGAMVPLFFFSNRRRHTSWPRDWSSDVCSSDLTGWCRSGSSLFPRYREDPDRHQPVWLALDRAERDPEIGRASCRERGEVGVSAVPVEWKGFGGRGAGDEPCGDDV